MAPKFMSTASEIVIQTSPNSDPIFLDLGNPAKADRTRDANYRSSNHAQGQTVVLQELGPVPVVELDWFLSNLLPEASSKSNMENDSNTEIGDFIKNLTSGGIGRAVATATGDPKIKSHLSQLSKKNNESQRDGFFALGDEATRIRATGSSEWWDIICPIEFNKSRGKAAFENNVAEMKWNLNHIMREDPRRRFTFGITIEGTDTRFWFASRSVVLVSKSFDFIKDPRPLIRMMHFLTHASEEQLGYDTTMHRSQSQLSINVGGRVFRTEKLLDDSAANSLLGRGTRVWSGFFEDGTRAVLKDCWIEHDRQLEGDVLTTLREQHGKLDDPEKPDFDDYFLTVVAHGKARLLGGAEDDTQEMMNGEVPVANNWLDVTDHPRARPDPQKVERAVRHAFKRRCHYRISFRDVATPLYEVVNLQDYMTALRDTAVAIGILHRLGYVHRDISSGNVLLYDGGGRLSDLEYCRSSSEPDRHDARTGTPDFMSVEVAAGNRLFVPPNGYGHPAYSSPPFQYFTLHDAESVWWLFAFALFSNGIQDESPDEDREDRQVENAEDMFPMSLNSATRQNYFVIPGSFEEMKDSLPSVLHPLFDIAEDLRCQLGQAYRAAELTETLELGGVHLTLLQLRETLDDAIRLSQGITLVPGLEFDHKRPAISLVEESEEDTGREGVKKRRRRI
ncbi:hypothetical protein BD779DRAFT_1803027 [Infundibulicybe gibba]|nr:hypothetical protein BD779DRAFT_1803027 [Infundibulicybe gibba]